MEGIVIKSIDYKEKSKIVYLYTPFGIKSVKAIDVLKTKLGFVTTLNVVEFEVTGGKLPTVTEYSLKESFYSLFDDLTKVGVLAPILDVIQHLEEHVNHERIYSFLKRTLDALKKAEEPHFILSLFLVKMLAVFGVRPELKACVLCNRVPIVNFSISEGGGLCSYCSTPNEKNYQLYEVFQYLYYTNTFETHSLAIPYKELLEAIYTYYSIHANMKLKSFFLF